MSTKGLHAIKNNDFHYVDSEGDKVTKLVDGKECVFVVFDKNKHSNYYLLVFYTCGQKKKNPSLVLKR